MDKKTPAKSHWRHQERYKQGEPSEYELKEGGDRETEQEKKQLSCLVAKSKRLGYFISFKLILLKFVHHKNLFKKKTFIVVVYLFFIFL